MAGQTLVAAVILIEGEPPQVIEAATLDDLAGRIAPGSLLAIPADYGGVAMALTRAIIRQRNRGLRLLCVPTSGMQADLLIGAGCVASIETSAVTMGELGRARCFGRAVERGEIVIRDTTCPAVHAGLEAAEKGIPFMPLRGLIGSDVQRYRYDWQIIQNPLATGPDPIVILPAIKPDIAIFHAPAADEEGNIWIGRRRELALMARASKRTLVTVERIRPGSFFEQESTAAGALAGFYIDAVAVAEHGAWPHGLSDLYPPDLPHMQSYVEASKSPEGLLTYLDRFVFEAAAVPA